MIEAELKARAAALGFGLTGIAPATDADTFALYDRWLSRGFAGDMAYLHKHNDARRHPDAILKDCRSVLMLGFDYSDNKKGSDPFFGRVAAYAQGPDYHDTLRGKLNALAHWLDTARPGSASRGVVDTAPLLERDFARRAGLGWFGKNTMLIHPRRGSFFLLAALLTTVELAADAPFTDHHCGTCTACLDACPTQAFPEPGVLDATRCISYLTIEQRGRIPLELRSGIGDWLHGCDVCQDVCPWNRFAPPNPAFERDPHLVALDCREIIALDDAGFRRRFRGTPLFRDKRRGLVRNACIVLGNTADRSVIPALSRLVTDADAVIADAAAWAIEQIQMRWSSSI
jgi:epoxyqueuosine reductase